LKRQFLLYAFLFSILASCNQSGNTESPETNTAKATPTQTAVEEKPAPANNSAASADDNAIATIDVNGVVIKLHQLVKFEPKGNQFLKADNAKFNYYITDVSITNNTNETINAGTDFDFAIDIESKEGKRFWKIDPSAKVLSLHDMEVAKRDQAAYDKLWSKINAGEKVRSFLKGYEVPKEVVPYKFIYDNVGKGIKKEQVLNQ